MACKRKLVRYGGEDEDDSQTNVCSTNDLDQSHERGAIVPPPFVGVSKRQRKTDHSSSRDIISTLSDELLIRICSFLDEQTLLDISPISRRFSRITCDSQLWRPHYYHRFILPRAHRIPGFRTGTKRGSSKLRYSAGKSIWADGGWGRRGGVISNPNKTFGITPQEPVDWRKQYKLRHNWSRGYCAVEEVQVRDIENDNDTGTEGQTLVKVVDGLAITADRASGLRAWDLKTRRLISQTDFDMDKEPGKETAQPSCLYLDDMLLNSGLLDVAVGFEDGAFGIWRLDTAKARISLRYRHAKNCPGSLAAIAYGYFHVLTASKFGFISLFAFEHADTLPKLGRDTGLPPEGHGPDVPLGAVGGGKPPLDLGQAKLVTSLKSHSTRPPLALSIRRASASVIASIAYSFDAVGGWCIGIQDLDIRSSPLSQPDIVTSRLAYTLPTQTRSRTATASPPPSRSGRRPSQSPASLPDVEHDGPRRLCYSHPYLLATLPDNTLILHLCTSTASSLSISPGIRLWGHTSNISDAEITPQGKAVSVSARGEEIRVWELEGRVGGNSVELRPRQQAYREMEERVEAKTSGSPWLAKTTDDKRIWVGFDDEMVVVLKGTMDGKESLMVYDFT